MSLPDSFYCKSIYRQNYTTPTGRKRFVNVIHNRFKKTYQVLKHVPSKSGYEKISIIGVYKDKNKALKKAKSLKK